MNPKNPKVIRDYWKEAQRRHRIKLKLIPRNGETLDHSLVFHPDRVKDRLKELTQIAMTNMEHDEILEQRQKEFQKAVKSGELPKHEPRPTLSQGEKHERYSETAQALAKEILLQERQNLVDAKTEHIAKTLRQIIKQARFLVYTVDEEDNPRKVKICVERMFQPNWDNFRDVLYVEGYPEGVQRLNDIELLKTRLYQFKDYEPYLNDETSKLYHEASELLSLETVRIEKENVKKIA